MRACRARMGPHPAVNLRVRKPRSVVQREVVEITNEETKMSISRHSRQKGALHPPLFPVCSRRDKNRYIGLRVNVAERTVDIRPHCEKQGEQSGRPKCPEQPRGKQEARAKEKCPRIASPRLRGISTNPHDQ